ncbi:hypothetical protein [Pectobacterium odoriferum]|uniref:hypothetical protein n=1 Tax=Pectobacterium odoriferum TaxID=78398 RepID=UPI0005043E88|nr:hypothetical protein [Pectobacterium odoriferum]KGA33520.1 hypothetical protein KS43_14315 [Pectobacterium odoriferum]
MSGREESVKEHFDSMFRSACEHFGKIDILAHLNGLDNRFNADTLYSTFDNFFIIEFKSFRKNIKDEIKKPAVCLLCCGLSQNVPITTLHDSCHYLMWGQKRNKKLVADYDIYRNVVCNTTILPDCNGAKTMTLQPNTLSSHHLAYFAGNNQIGLNAHDFSIYLEWLLNSRNGSQSADSENVYKEKDNKGTFFSTIYATSEHYAVDLTFNSIDSMYQWATSDRAKPQRRNNDWGKFKP